MIKNLNYKNIILLILIIILHFVFVNGLEKLIFLQTNIPINYLLRPSKDCNNIKDEYITSCLGLPSGHSEIITIISYILFQNKYISLITLIGLIFIVSLQRIINKNHTIIQVYVGILFGLFYGILYNKTNISYISVFCTVLIIFCLVSILLIIIEYKIKYTKIPEWVNESMYENIRKKQNASIIIKYISIITPSFSQSRFLFIDWELLEKYLENIVIDIKKSNIKYDGVVGIKTGGAIISGYLSKKLKIPEYKIKISTIDNNCNKKTFDTFKTYYELYYENKDKEYIICEKIDENISNKNILLIDESISSGGTIKKAIDYLIDNKNVNMLSVYTIYTNKIMNYRNINIKAIKKTDNICLIWPWGYDN